MINRLIKSKNSKLKPKWFLRQAGRHIPEYFQIRNKHNNFLDFCYSENSIVDATLLPLKYYNVDAAILFSDILLLPHCLGQEINFKKNVGPILKKIEINDIFLKRKINFDTLSSINSAISKIRKLISPNQELIGFCGAPWTLACYMIEGQSSKDFIKTRSFLWNNEKVFRKFINMLIKRCVELLEFQYLAGATVLMIFDTWSNMIPDKYWETFGIKPTRVIIENLRSKNINCPVIGLPFKPGEMLIKYSYESLVDVVSIDWKTNLEWALRNINKNIVTQGNLDPVLLSTENLLSIKKEVVRILQLTQNRLHIFNVGHGLIPTVKVKNLKYVIELIDAS